MNKKKCFFLCTYALMLLCTAVLVLLSSAVGAWEPPIGIPRPEFGIEETYRMYNNPANRNSALQYHQNTDGGYYTHYTDNTHPGATDKDNPYGIASKPRKTIPDDVPAGSVVEIHNGPYTGPINVKGTGNSAQPVFFRGISGSEPEMGGNLYIQGSYVIFENLYINNVTAWLNISAEYGRPGPIDHISIRYCEFEGDGIFGDDDAISMYSPDSTPVKTDIVLYSNEIHSYGEWEAATQNDAHGVGIGPYTERVWMLDNHVYNCAGDGVQVWGTYGVKFIYIGRNTFHHNRECAVAMKGCADVIVSENICYGFVPTDTRPGGDSSADGHAIRPDNEGAQDNLWIIYNTIYDCEHGVHSWECSFPPYVIGNLIYDMNDVGIRYDAGWVINNTIYDCDTGMEECDNVINNIVYNCATYHFDDCNNVDHNLLWQDAGVDGGDIAMIDTTNTNGIESDPLFVDPANGIFRLQSMSPAIDAGTSSGIVQEVFDRFEQLYGIDIRKDCEGTARPYGQEWDIGAFEYDPGTPAEHLGIDPNATSLNVYNNIITKKNLSALIACNLTEAAEISLIIYDSKGTKKIVLCNDHRDAGLHTFTWSGLDASGSSVGSGIYMVHIKSGGYTETKKIAVVR